MIIEDLIRRLIKQNLLKLEKNLINYTMKTEIYQHWIVKVSCALNCFLFSMIFV